MTDERPAAAARAIEAIGVTKAFGATLALDNVDFQAVRAEVTVLMGENGAGKSTLMKILAGEIAPDSGYLALAGERVRFRSPREARLHGVALIHQELSLFPALRVADNIFAGLERGRAGLIDDRQHAALARDILARLDPQDRSRGARRQPRGRSAADRRDREGARGRRARRDHGRADVGAQQR